MRIKNLKRHKSPVQREGEAKNTSPSTPSTPSVRVDSPVYFRSHGACVSFSSRWFPPIFVGEWAPRFYTAERTPATLYLLLLISFFSSSPLPKMLSSPPRASSLLHREREKNNGISTQGMILRDPLCEICKKIFIRELKMEISLSRKISIWKHSSFLGNIENWHIRRKVYFHHHHHHHYDDDVVAKQPQDASPSRAPGVGAVLHRVPGQEGWPPIQAEGRSRGRRRSRGESLLEEDWHPRLRGGWSWFAVVAFVVLAPTRVSWRRVRHAQKHSQRALGKVRRASFLQRN